MLLAFIPLSAGWAGVATRPPLDRLGAVLAPLPDPEANRVESLQQKLRNDPASLKTLERLGFAFVELATESGDPGYFHLSMLCGALLEARGEEAAGLFLRGTSSHSLHRFREAEAIGRQLVTLRGNWFDHGLHGDALLELGRVEAATSAYQAMMDQRPGPESYARAAALRWQTGDIEGAIEMMQLAVRSTSPRRAEPLAWALTRLSLLKRALGDRAGATRAACRRA